MFSTPTTVITLVAVYLVILRASSGVFAQECAAGSASKYKGNWYCSPVKAITYSGFPGTGWYNRITNMDANTGECTSRRYDYSGSLSPLNEEVVLNPEKALEHMLTIIPAVVSRPRAGTSQPVRRLHPRRLRYQTQRRP